MDLFAPYCFSPVIVRVGRIAGIHWTYRRRQIPRSKAYQITAVGTDAAAAIGSRGQQACRVPVRQATRSTQRPDGWVNHPPGAKCRPVSCGGAAGFMTANHGSASRRSIRALIPAASTLSFFDPLNRRPFISELLAFMFGAGRQ